MITCIKKEEKEKKPLAEDVPELEARLISVKRNRQSSASMGKERIACRTKPLERFPLTRGLCFYIVGFIVIDQLHSLKHRRHTTTSTMNTSTYFGW